MTENTTELRVGVVGLGFAGTTHLDAFQSLPGTRVVALAGQEEARLHELGATRGVPDLYADWEDLVARDDLDVVSIGVPNHLHHPIAVASLASGKHVFCEKPLATTAELAAEMVEAARTNDRVLEIAYNHRRRADVAFLRDYLDDAPLGDVYHARASWQRRTGIPGIGSWFTSKELAGGGPLIDLGSHVLDIALHLLDEPRVTSVSAVAYGEIGRSGRGGRPHGVAATGTHAFEVEDFSSALLRLDNGRSLQLDASWASYSKVDEDIEVELLGSAGGAPPHRRLRHGGDSDALLRGRRSADRLAPRREGPRRAPPLGHRRVPGGHRLGSRRARGRPPLLRPLRRVRAAPQPGGRRDLPLRRREAGGGGRMSAPIEVLVWNEFRHETRGDETVLRHYPDGIHRVIADGLAESLGDAVSVRTATLPEPEHGLTEEALATTDVLLWWGHIAHEEVSEEVVQRVLRHVQEGMGILVLHSGHYSSIFKALMGTTCSLKWRNDRDRELVWTIAPTHPIAEGVPSPLIIPEQEMYGEYFDIPVPEETVFLSTFTGGEVFRSGVTYTRGLGKVFYFSPGDQDYPVYHHPDIRRVLANAVRWARPTRPRTPLTADHHPRGWFES
ncbi:hypothetical protein C5C25_05670 [Rathayibacter sp. AY2B9]|nr:hypothetical protein C5C25_05670 [Rathayibacter sp. AY2B9]